MEYPGDRVAQDQAGEQRKRKVQKRSRKKKLTFERLATTRSQLFATRLNWRMYKCLQTINYREASRMSGVPRNNGRYRQDKVDMRIAEVVSEGVCRGRRGKDGNRKDFLVGLGSLITANDGERQAEKQAFCE